MRRGSGGGGGRWGAEDCAALRGRDAPPHLRERPQVPQRWCVRVVADADDGPHEAAGSVAPGCRLALRLLRTAALARAAGLCFISAPARVAAPSGCRSSGREHEARRRIDEAHDFRDAAARTSLHAVDLVEDNEGGLQQGRGREGGRVSLPLIRSPRPPAASPCARRTCSASPARRRCALAAGGRSGHPRH